MLKTVNAALDGQTDTRHLFVGGEREVCTHHAVTIVSEQNDARLFRVHVKRLEV